MCVLLVEDEAVIREVMAECLTDAGFEVREAASGEEAVAAIEQGRTPFTVLVTDFHMPGATNGGHVAASMRRTSPDVPVVIASGRPDMFEPAWRRDGYALLRKPYMGRDLVALVRRLMMARASRRAVV